MHQEFQMLTLEGTWEVWAKFMCGALMILVYNTLEQTRGVHSILKNIWQPTVQAECSQALFCLVVIVRLPTFKLRCKAPK